MKFVFFKTPKNKQFNYTPIFYDERKEKMEKRMKEAQIGSGKAYHDDLKERMSHSWKRKQKSNHKYSIIRSFIIMIIVTTLIFIFMTKLTGFIDRI